MSVLQKISETEGRMIFCFLLFVGFLVALLLDKLTAEQFLALMLADGLLYKIWEKTSTSTKDMMPLLLLMQKIWEDDKGG